jgi:hopanoid biosynthesis associated RND transporter like protein HpnN
MRGDSVAIIVWLTALVDFSRQRAWPVAVGALALAIAAGWYTASHLGVDTDTSNLLSPDLPWQIQSRAFDKAFPQNVSVTTIVVDGDNPDIVAGATERLAGALARRTDLFKSVRRPDYGPFFDRYGLLFLPSKELSKLSDQLAAAQPLLGPLDADPSLRGLFGVLDQALTGLESGEATAGKLAGPMAAFAKTIDSVTAGHPQPLSWSTLMTGRSPQPEELRHFIQVQPKLDYSALEPGLKASAAIRETARALGLPALGVRVRLTGDIPLEDDEFASVSEGAGLATALSLGGILLVLLAGLRAPRLVLAIILTLLAGLTYTACFAALSVGSLNMISVAFAVLFIGIGVDFGIQFSMRYRAELYTVTGGMPPTDRRGAHAEAVRRTGRGIGAPLGLAALSTCAGFFSFLPTDYQGVSELGLIAGTSMLIALACNLTILPALLTILPQRGTPEPAGFAWAAPVDRMLARHARTIVAVAALVGIAGVASIPWVRFDADPLDLKDPHKESVATALELTRDPLNSPYTIELLRPDQAAADALAQKLSTLPEVKQALTLSSLVPDDQARKLDILGTTQLLMGPIVAHLLSVPPPTFAQEQQALTGFTAHLHKVLNGPKGPSLGPAARSLAASLDRLLAAPDLAGKIPTLEATLIGGFEARIDSLRQGLQATTLTLPTMPAEVREDWVAADGRARVSVFPSGDMHDQRQLARFVAAVRVLAPDATGAPVTILESGNTVSHAFLTASLLALATITILLAIALRRLVDLAVVILPLLLAGLCALGTCVAVGQAFNYANVIAVPLLMGIGVAFDIYFLMVWRRDAYRQPQLLQSSTARAVVFSACTTAAAFGSLGLSHHVGTASMGILLVTTLGYVLLCTLVFQPALMTLLSRRP